ncbi:MAG TPA: Ig-like domain-containing protein [Gemmatimonadales bacterium]|nr:Ig-like domain-containing protein [Gemmatimonadales bacterium]
MRRRSVAVLCLLPALLECKAAFDIPPIARPLTISYPPGVVGDLPTSAIGAMVPLRVLVTDFTGRPQAGVAVIWDGQADPPPVLPAQTTTDADGLASATWEVRPYTGLQKAWAYLPGAEGNPVEFRVVVVIPAPK